MQALQNHGAVRAGVSFYTSLVFFSKVLAFLKVVDRLLVFLPFFLGF